MSIIYQITNEVNGNFYIGKTTKDIKTRWKFHLYEASYGTRRYLYNAIRKYDEKNFTVKILEDAIEEKDINDKERYYISKLNPKYNMTSGGEGGDVSSSPNFIEEMKKQHSNRSPESYATYGMLGKKFPEEGKIKISEANSYPVVCEGKEFPSIKVAEEYYKNLGTPKSVRKRIDNPKHTDWYRVRPKRDYPRK